jgi:hypothetical protein
MELLLVKVGEKARSSPRMSEWIVDVEGLADG